MVAAYLGSVIDGDAAAIDPDAAALRRTAGPARTAVAADSGTPNSLAAGAASTSAVIDRVGLVAP